MTEARHEVIVHHPDRLHERIADGGPDEAKPALGEGFAHCVRLSAAGWQVSQGAPTILLGRPAYEAPEKGAETTFLLLELEECAGIADGRAHLLPVSHDSWIFQYLFDLSGVVARHPRGVESVEHLEKAGALVEDYAPREPRLEPVEHELREQLTIAVERHTPFLVVVGEHQGIVVTGPAAFDHGPRILHAPGPHG